MGRAFLRAVAASLIVGIVVPAVLFLTVQKAGIPKERVQVPSDFYNWSLHEQNEWNIRNLELVGGFAYIRERMKYPAKFAISTPRSNNTVERDARQERRAPHTVNVRHRMKYEPRRPCADPPMPSRMWTTSNRM